MPNKMAQQMKDFDVLMEKAITTYSLVEFNRPQDKAKRPGVYMVTRVNPSATVSMVKVGDDSGMYIRGCSPRLLDKVDPSRVTFAPAS